MARPRCKATRKDGCPCQGVPLKKYDGYCLAHGAPPDQAHKWRSLGGRNSATAVRRDKRIPENLKGAIDLVQDCMQRAAAGELSPAACNAVCRSAQTLIGLHRRADEVMETIRAEEIMEAAAERLDVHTDLDVLEATDHMKPKRDRFRRESLVDQGFAQFTEPSKPDEPPEVVLNKRGRLRFGFQNVENRQAFLEEVDDDLLDFVWGGSNLPDLPKITGQLEDAHKDIEKSLSGLKHGAEAPFDPMTGQPFTRLPDGVKIAPLGADFCPTHTYPQEALPRQLGYIKKLKRKIEEISESENYIRRLAEPQTDSGNQAGLGKDKGKQEGFEAYFRQVVMPRIELELAGTTAKRPKRE